MNLKNILLILCLFMLFAACKTPANTETPTPAKTSNGKIIAHQAWEELLQQNVDELGFVNYAAFQQDRAKLNAYLAGLAAIAPADYTKEQQLALWINSYNAFVVVDVLDDVRGKVKSVNDIADKFFRTKKHRVAGSELTLDEIEKNGRALNDPRIHFAIVCASVSCPKLQRFAYTGEKLDYQLGIAAREFLGDARRGSRYDSPTNTLYISPIFKWYAADFTNENTAIARAKAELSGNDLLKVIIQYVPNDVKLFLQSRTPRIDYFDYDWTLNQQLQNQPIKTQTPANAPDSKH